MSLERFTSNPNPFTKSVEFSSTKSTVLIKVDRYLLSKTWYDLLNKLSGKNPSQLDKTMIGLAYGKIVKAMENMSDEELLDSMQDIIDCIDFARLNIVGLRKDGYYKK